MAAAMRAMTTTRRNGSSAASDPSRRQRDSASTSAISAIVNAVKPNSNVYQVAVKPRNNPAPTTAAQPPERSPARNPDHVSTSIGGSSTVIIAA